MSDLLIYAPIIIAWLLFGFFHSVLASTLLKEKIDLKPVNFRRLYNIFSILAVLFILFLGSSIEPNYLFPKDQTGKTIGLIIATFGFLLAKLAFRPISFSEFIGIKSEQNQHLITEGIYARMRHPLYAAAILGLIGFVIFSPTYTHLVHALCMVIYLLIGMHFEERRLLIRFGKEYEEYKKHTPMLFPNLKP